MARKKLTWTTIKYRLGDLMEYEKNPVQISERDAKELVRSLEKYEHVLPYVAAAPKNGTKGLPLLDGHQRKMVELSLRKVSPNTLVDVRVPSRKLSDKEKQELVIRLRKNTGEFDFDKLANFFEVDELLDWGFKEYELYLQGFDLANENDPNKEWEGMPEFKQKDLSAVKQIVVNFKTIDDYAAFAKLIKQKLTDKTRSIWYPQAEKINMRDTYEA